MKPTINSQIRKAHQEKFILVTNKSLLEKINNTFNKFQNLENDFDRPRLLDKRYSRTLRFQDDSKRIKLYQ